MNWQEIIKALITLPQKNKDSWVEILSSDENMRSFKNRIRGGKYGNAGIKNTLSFLRDDNSAKHLEDFSSIDHDEEEIVRRYNENKSSLITLLENRINRTQGLRVRAGKLQGEALVIENNKRVFDLLDTVVEARPSNVSVNSNMGKHLLSIEKYFVDHPKQLRRMKNELLSNYGEFFTTWPIPGIAEQLMSNPNFATTGVRHMRNPAYQEEWRDNGVPKLETLIKVFKDFTPPTITYTANTLDANLTSVYYKNVAKYNNLLIPDELQASDLFLNTKKLKIMNKNLILLLTEDNPFLKVDAEARKIFEEQEEHFDTETKEGQKVKEERLRDISGKGLILTIDAYDDLVAHLGWLENREEKAKLSDGNFPQHKELKLLGNFLNLTINKKNISYISNETKEEESEEVVQIIAPRSMRIKVSQVFSEIINENELPEEINIKLKTMEETKTNTSDVLSDIELDNLTGDVEPDVSLINLLNVIQEADEALDLNSFTDYTIEEFEDSVSKIREEIIELTQEKVEDIVQNPINYRTIKPVKSAEVDRHGTQIKRESTIFNVLVNNKIITEVSS